MIRPRGGSQITHGTTRALGRRILAALALVFAAAGLTVGADAAASAYPAPPPAPNTWVFTTWLTGPDGKELDPFNLAAGQPIAIHTQGLPPGTVAVTSMFSDPVKLHAGVVSDTGAYDPVVSIPAEVLQSTISENDGRLFGWMAPMNRRMQDVNHWLEAKKWHRWLGASASILVTAVVLSFSDPDFGFDVASLRLLAAITISLAIVNLIPLGMAALEADRRFDADSLPMAMPGTILIAAVSVAVSRLGGLEPGLIFGIVVGISYSIHLTTRRAGQLIIVQFAGLAAVGLLAWLAYDLIGPAAPGDSGWHMLLREVLSATALDALVAPAIVMLPLTFLDGRSVWRWSKPLWVAIYALAAMLLAFIALPIARDVDEVPSGISGWLIALGIFTAVAVVVWVGLRQKDRDRDLVDA